MEVEVEVGGLAGPENRVARLPENRHGQDRAGEPEAMQGAWFKHVKTIGIGDVLEWFEDKVMFETLVHSCFLFPSMCFPKLFAAQPKQGRAIGP